MVSKKNKGSALIVVIMVMAVMTILGAAILNISLSQTMQASNEDKRIQAHYLARSGAEATVSAWEVPRNVIKPSGSCKTVYLDSSNQFIFVDTPPTNIIGKFDVIVTPPVNQGDDTVVTSVGTVGNVKQTVKATIKTITTTVPISPQGSIAGETLGWYSYNSGQINTGVNTSGKGKVVTLKAKNGLKIPNKNSPVATFEADQMQFMSPIQVFHNGIILSAKLIDFSNNYNSNGTFVLKVLDDGFKPNGSHFTGAVGVVFFQDVGYYFKNVVGGITLNDSSDIQSQVTANNFEKIIDLNFKNPFSSTTTQTIKSYSVTWN
ncbi:pilus assembly PilX N-terminal domain-containing protein [Clostridium psychrophilum]|uniref:pilus assembly PilX N-terminal domain-containing protein n=1 Tax=Clostridium psychrophilum TaxID=132926 RepID=UPI001C0C9E2E|nr:pilus assembly PilX N-terminal domain-containing protein [Clostridium psychrophilum]MBU3182042.1 pilus assembly PilX N-terminal domain-containing protein [Clostridium psychrophilum]